MIKKNFTITLSLLTIWSINAQTYFSDQNVIIQPETLQPQSVYACDIDGDGDQDLLSASSFDDKIAWYENVGGLYPFGNQQIISTTAVGAQAVYACDIDGDGDQDVLSASWDDDKIAWYENTDGKGTFGEERIISVYSEKVHSIYACDIDGDGDQDILSAAWGDNMIAWHENTDGKGTFGGIKVISNSAGGAFSVIGADMDGDGDMDVVSGYSSGAKVVWYENYNGEGYFETEQLIVDSVYMPKSVQVCDIDGDGDLDVFASSYLGDKIVWVKNTDGLGTFGEDYTITTSARAYESIFSCDIDGDGDMDLLSASYLDNEISWYENTDGNGTFGETLVISNSARAAQSVYAFDIDNDGDQDVLSASQGDSKIAWYENTDGNGTFGVQRIITASAEGACSVYACDIDSDGDDDVLSASQNDNKIAWYENTDGNGNFGEQQIITTSAEGAQSVYACDIDGDGDQDVLSASYYDNKIAWYENTDGNGTYETQQVITTAYRATSVYACDIDGDGDQDILSASYNDNKIAWYENTDGNGSFGEQQVIATSATGATSVYACDIDGDGDLDVLSASSDDDKIAWYQNIDGNGTFGAEQIITTFADYARSVYACDIDGDGDQDVLSASNDDDKIAWYENIDGSGTFGEQQVITTSADNAKVYACDIDGDGDQDVFSASWADNKIAWYENTDGKGTFGGQQIITTSAIGAQSVYTCDIDGDGDQDLLSASYADNKIAWYEYYLSVISQPIDEIICPDSDAEFSLTTNGVDTFHWQVNEGDGFIDLSENEVYSGVASNNLTIISASTDMNGNIYRCILLNQDICVNSDEVVLTVEDNTAPTISCLNNQTVVTNGTNYYIVNGAEFDPVETNDNCGIEGIENDFNNASSLAGAEIPIGATTIIWKVIDNSGNESTCNFVINVIASSVEVKNLQQIGISIFPNPTDGIVNFEFGNNKINKLAIFNITGNQIFKITQVQQNEIINIADFESGIYIMSIHTDKEKLTIRLIKE